MLRSSLGIRQFRQDSCLSYVLYDRPSRQALVVDPRVDLMQDYRAFIAENGLKVCFAVDTRLQFDHLSATHLFRNEFDCAIVMSAQTESKRPDTQVVSGDTLNLGDLAFHVLDAPGCSQDSICLEGSGLLFSGDSLWIQSVARVDLPGCDSAAYWRSQHQMLAPLSEHTVIFPGHDSHDLLFSTLGTERKRNPCYRVTHEEVFVAAKADERHPIQDDFDLARRAFNLSASPSQEGRLGTFGGAPLGSSRSEVGLMANINIEKFRRKLSEANPNQLFIDVREEAEFREGHIPGTLNLPLSEMGLHLAELRSAERVYLSCLSGRRSAVAAKTLTYIGLADVVLVRGGFQAWQQLGLPVT